MFSVLPVGKCCIVLGINKLRVCLFFSTKCQAQWCKHIDVWSEIILSCVGARCSSMVESRLLPGRESIAPW